MKTDKQRNYNKRVVVFCKTMCISEKMKNANSRTDTFIALFETMPVEDLSRHAKHAPTTIQAFTLEGAQKFALGKGHFELLSLYWNLAQGTTAKPQGTTAKPQGTTAMAVGAVSFRGVTLE